MPLDLIVLISYLFVSDKPVRIGYDMNAREELIRSYNEKEISLSESLEKDRRLSKNLKMEIKCKWLQINLVIIIVNHFFLCKALKNYAR
jgi:hypothetical protein